MTFKEEILQGIPAELPQAKAYDPQINHAPKRKDILSEKEKVLAIKNALRYFPAKHHRLLAEEFAKELLALLLQFTTVAAQDGLYLGLCLRRRHEGGP